MLNLSWLKLAIKGILKCKMLMYNQIFSLAAYILYVANTIILYVLSHLTDCIKVRVFHNKLQVTQFLVSSCVYTSKMIVK